MIFGLNLPNYSSLGHRDAVTVIAERAEELGYASLWTSDHVLLPQTLPEPQQAATVHHLSGGRLTVGVGVGWIEQEYGFLRADFAGCGHTADEYIPAMRALFETDKPEFHGPHISYADVLFSPRPSPRLPIVVGGTSPAALRRAAALGDGWYGIARTPGEVAAAVTVLAQHGRTDGFGVSLRTKARLGAAADGTESTLHGSAAQIADQARRFSAAGVGQLILEIEATELDDFLNQLTRFAREVAPRLPA